MELAAKETRIVILGLKKLLEDIQSQLRNLSEEDDEYAFLSNDAALVDIMISGFEEEYRTKYSEQDT